jgi:hypothetical protein
MHALQRLLPVALLLSIAGAQTTGVPGTNDYTLNALGSGTTSCTFLCFPTPVTLSMQAWTPTGNFVFFLFSFCPCFGCSQNWSPNACVPAIPPTACGSTTNQSVDILPQPGCPLFVVGSAISVGGVATFNWVLPPLGPPCASARGSTQALIFSPCGVGSSAFPGPFVLSQAYNLAF